MTRSGRAIRAASLLILAALAVHQLRYLLAYGHDTGAALAHQGHAYLAGWAPIAIALALAGAFAALIVPALFRLERRSEPDRSSLAGETLLFAIAVLSIFSVQELAEGGLAAGHPSGAAAIIAGGGWLALPLSLLAGLGCALVARFLDLAGRALSSPERRPAHARVRRRLLRIPSPPEAQIAWVPRPLAFGVARRGPPRPHA